MSSIACYLDHNAQDARLLTPEGDSKWIPTSDFDADDPFGPRNSLADAASWLTKSIGTRKRIDLICLGVTESMCRWLTAPSAEPSVIAAAARGKGEEWGSKISLGTIEPLTAPHRRSRTSHAVTKSESHFPVLAIRDAPIRVLLDDLNSAGVRVGSVITLWHAMCRAWDESLPTERAREELRKGSDNGNTEPAAASPITAIITTTDDHSIVWAWSKGRQLATGGRANVGRTDQHDAPIDSFNNDDTNASRYDTAFGRIALDWLTWGAQLGTTPERIIIISPNADSLAAQCDRLWPTASHQQIPEIDPVTATLNRLIIADPIKPEADARTCVTALTNRPSRSHRQLNQWVGIALLALAIVVIGFGWQFHSQASGYSDQEQRLRSEMRTKLTAIDERIARDPRPSRALENKINQLAAEGSDGFVEPQLPLPILNELIRVGTSLAGVEDVKIERIEITESRSTLRLQIPDTVTAELIIEALRTSDGKIRWVESGSGFQSGRLVFNGAWILEEERL